jgi:hypothetical protein
MDTLGFRARCPQCQTERWLHGPHPARTPADLDAIEHALPKVFRARCPRCDGVEEVAMFVDGSQAEPWQNADKMERQHGPGAGPLPPKPWPETN